MKLKGIDGGPHKRWSMWFNSMQREEPYLVLTSTEVFIAGAFFVQQQAWIENAQRGAQIYPLAGGERVLEVRGEYLPIVELWKVFNVAGAKILGNIEVGRGAKIGAGSVVLQPVPPHTTAAGVPARIVG